jgi:glycosyltransferase involved in cell wall biosynthesis
VSGIHHFVPVLHRGDAVGRHTLRLRDATRGRGIASDIYVDVVEDDTAEETKLAVSYADEAQRGDVVVYQFATASYMAPWLAGRSETLVVNYHNITPPELMAPWDHHLALGQARAQGDLRVLAPRTTLAVADSAYNESHLAAAGFTATAVIPPSAAVDGSGVPAEAGRPRRREGQGGARWLAVGRVSPNKALEDTIAALAVTRAHRDPAATLSVVGKPATEAYDAALRRYAAELGLTGAVTFTGHARDTTVATAYATADVLVVTSAHEGFCVPVVEAMTAGLPVVALDQGALPEVLGDAGTLVTSRNPYDVAAAVGALLDDASRREALADAARRRLAALDLTTAADRFAALLSTLLDGQARRR